MNSRLVSDPQLFVLADVASQFADPAGYAETEGASQVGMNRRSLAKLIEGGHLARTDTGDSDTYGGRYRLHLTDAGREQLRRGIERGLVPPSWFGHALLPECSLPQDRGMA